MSMVHEMLTMAEVGPDDLVYDLGCGDGRILITAAGVMEQGRSGSNLIHCVTCITCHNNIDGKALQAKEQILERKHMIVIGPIALLIIVLIFAISAAWTNFVGAPWVPTSMGMVNKMLKLAEVGPDDIVYDLGCGDGRTIITAAWRYRARAVGIEIDPLRYFWCQLLITLLGLRKRVRIIYWNFFNHNLSEATVVTCYLLQDTNNKLEEKLKNELRIGTRVVSNTFTFLGLNSVCQDGIARLYTI